MVLLKAIEAGVDVVDTCLSPLGNGTSQPATESLVATLKGTEYDTGLDLDLLSAAGGALPRRWRMRLTKDGWRRPGARAGRGRQHPAVSGAGRHAVQPDWPAEAGEPDGQVLRRAGGECRASARTSAIRRWSRRPRQIVGTQAVMNVHRRRALQDGAEGIQGLAGGSTTAVLPGKVNEDVRKKCIGDTKVITHRYADDIPPGTRQAA